MIREGCVLTARQIMQSEVWILKPTWWLKVWNYLYLKVNHEDNKRFKRGQGFFNRRMIYEQCYLQNEGIKIKSIDNVIHYFKKQGMLKTRKTTRGMIITICNYDLYQRLSNYQKDTEKDIEKTQKRHRKDTINKNDKNVKKDKNKRKKYIKKEKYAEFVKMTKVEYQKLIEKYGKEDTLKMIEKLDNAKGSKGYIYKSDYRAILSWVVDEVLKNQQEEDDPYKNYPTDTEY